MNVLMIVLIGLVGGLVSGLFGVGGGTVFVPMLILLCHYNPHLAVGTSLAVVVPAALIATITHARGGMVDWRSALCMALLAMAGAWLGSMISMRLDATILKKVYSVFLIGIALKLFFSS